MVIDLGQNTKLTINSYFKNDQVRNTPSVYKLCQFKLNHS
jgi:hypothetical protein